MKRGIVVVLMVLLGGLVLIGSGGCGDFRERAAEVETRIAAAEDASEVAAQAAAANTARILELQDRIEALEQQLGELLDQGEGS